MTAALILSSFPSLALPRSGSEGFSHPVARTPFPVCKQPGPLACVARRSAATRTIIAAMPAEVSEGLPYNVRFRLNTKSTMELAKSFEPADIEQFWRTEWEQRGYFTATTDPGKPVVQHPAAAAERDRHPAHGACVQPDHHGWPDPLLPHARLQHGLDSGHRPRRHRDPDRGRTPARRAKDFAPRPRPRKVRRKSLGMERKIRLHHHRPDAPPGRLDRLEPRILHDGRAALRRP